MALRNCIFWDGCSFTLMVEDKSLLSRNLLYSVHFAVWDLLFGDVNESFRKGVAEGVENR